MMLKFSSFYEAFTFSNDGSETGRKARPCCAQLPAQRLPIIQSTRLSPERHGAHREGVQRQNDCTTSCSRHFQLSRHILPTSLLPRAAVIKHHKLGAGSSGNTGRQSKTKMWRSPPPLRPAEESSPALAQSRGMLVVRAAPWLIQASL